MDVLSTTYALQTGIASEANPLALFLWENFEALGLLAPKLLATALIAGLLAKMTQWGFTRSVKASKILTVSIMALVVINNLMVIS